jgi:colanic acid/amylovoran biosynthesis glycosyltransferase
MAARIQSKNNLHILVAGTRWPMETFITRLVDGLLNSKLNVTVACAQKPDDDWLQRVGFCWLPVPDTNRALPAIWIPYIINILQTLFTSPRRFLNHYQKLARADGPDHSRRWLSFLPFLGRHWDVIYFPWNSAALLFNRLFALERPVVLSCRGSQVNVAPHNPQRQDFRDGLNTTFEKVTRVHCVSQDILQEAARLGLDPAKAKVIRPAVDPDFFFPSQGKIISRRFTVVSTGSLVWVKGFEYALLAIHQLRNEGLDVEFQIIGEGPERQRILYTIEDLGLQNCVVLHGKRPPDEVRNCLQKADVFLLSSLSEGISNAALEAMACGLPVVTTNCGGMSEAVSDGAHGFVVSVRDPASMAKALGYLADHPEARREMGIRARERVIRDFHLQGQVQQFVDLFQEVSNPDRSISFEEAACQVP